MKTENLEKALQSFDLLKQDIRAAHTDAVYSENRFAETSVFSILEMITAIEPKIRRAGVDAGIIK